MGRLRQPGDRLIACHVGDAIEGVHHGTTQLVTARIEEQERIFAASLGAGLELAGFDRETDELHMIAGTAAHVGSGATSEESIVRALLRIKPDEGVRQVHYHLRRRTNGVLFDIAHQGPPPGARDWTWSNPLRWYLQSIYLRCLEERQPVPRYVIRAHRHQFVTADVRTIGGGVAVEGFVLPASTLKGEYAAGKKPEALAHVGMVIVGVEPDGQSWHRVELLAYQQEAVIDDDLGD